MDIYGQLIYTKKPRIYSEKRSVSSINGVRKIRESHGINKLIKTGLLPIPYIKINLKWIKELKVRTETIKLLDRRKFKW